MKISTLCCVALLLTGSLLLPGCREKGNGKTGSDLVKAYQKTHSRFTAEVPGDDVPFVTIATADKAATLDLHNTDNGGDVKVMNQIYQNLVRIDPKNVDRLMPELAESWEVSDDGLSIRFAIRPKVSFHDGVKLDAQAVKLSLDRLRGAYLDVPAAPYRSYYDFIEGMDADGMNLTVRLNRPVARVALRNLSMFSAGIVSPKLLQATVNMDTKKRSEFISQWASGTGPYFLSKFDSSAARVRLQAFDAYWDGAPKISKLIIRQVPDPNSQIEYIKSGVVDMLDDAPRPEWESLEADGKIKLHKWWALNLCYLGVNVKHPLTSDIKVRQAIRLAIDRDALLGLYYGTARPTYSMVAQPLGEYDPDYRAPGIDKPLEERQAAARELLKQSDAVGRQLKIYFPKDPRPYLPTPQKIADKLRQQLDAVGLTVEIVAVPNAELFSSVRNDQYELVLIGWMSDNADADNFYVPLTSGDGKEPSTNNAGRTFDPKLHKALLKAQSLTDKAKRIEAYRSIERQMQVQEVGHVPLVNTQQGIAFGPRLDGVEVDALGHYRFHKATIK